MSLTHVAIIEAKSVKFFPEGPGHDASCPYNLFVFNGICAVRVLRKF